MKPVLKAPGSVLLKLRYDGPLSNFAFNLNLRRYRMVRLWAAPSNDNVPFLHMLSWHLFRRNRTWQGGARRPYQAHVESAWN